MRQETSLRVWAFRRSVFVRRAPTPNVRTSVADTTRTSCPRASAASAMPNAGTGLHDHPALRPPLEELLQGQSIRPRLVQDRPIACSDAHLGFPSSEIDRTMLHGWYLLFAANRPRVNRERRYSRQLVEKEPATSSSLQTSAKPSRRRRRLRQYSCAATLDSMTRSSTT